MSIETQENSIQLYFRMIDILGKLADVRFKVVDEHGISTPQFIVMCKLQQNPRITQQELAKELHVTKGNISQMMKIMQRDGLIQRHADGAAFRLSLTGKAETILQEIVPEQHRLIQAQMDVLSEEDYGNLTIILNKLERCLTII